MLLKLYSDCYLPPHFFKCDNVSNRVSHCECPQRPDVRLYLPADMWSEALSKQKTLIQFGQWRSWGKLAGLEWPLGSLVARKSLTPGGPWWLGPRGRVQLESHSPTSLKGVCLAASVDSSVWKKGVKATEGNLRTLSPKIYWMYNKKQLDILNEK